MDISVIIVVLLAVGAFFSSFRDSQFTKRDKKLYMKSSSWKQKRERILYRDCYMCVSCLSSDQLEIHHKTYKRLGNEKDSDLVTLCRKCHQRQHDHYGYNYQTVFSPIV